MTTNSTTEPKTMFHDRDKARQLVDFSGMILSEGGKAYPTDVDGLIEWKNKAYVIIELKYGSGHMKFGQELAFTRLVDDLESIKPAILIVAKHLTPVTEDVDMGAAGVVKFRYKGTWSFPAGETVRSLTDWFINQLEEKDE